MTRTSITQTGTDVTITCIDPRTGEARIESFTMRGQASGYVWRWADGGGVEQAAGSLFGSRGDALENGPRTSLLDFIRSEWKTYRAAAAREAIRDRA